jgi:hypothetical protein
MRKQLLSICLGVLFLSCQNMKYVDIVITSKQRGWCFIIFTDDTSKLKFVDGQNYKIYLDSNNVAYLPKDILGKGYENKIYDKRGRDIKEKMKLFGQTGFDEKRDMLTFYYLTEKELKLPNVTWIEPNDYKDWELGDKADQKRDTLKKLGY